MKKYFAALAAAIACTLIALPFGAVASASAYRLENGEKVYSTVTDKIIYETQDPYDVSVNTFEAWIKLPKELADDIVGGVIFGNYYNTNEGFPGACNFQVGKGGAFELYWNRGAYSHTFASADLRNGKWTHVALVRDKEAGTLSYYVDGECLETVEANLGESVGDTRFCVGNDWNNWYVWYKYDLDRVPFCGQIRQVTVYSEAVSAETVAADMQSQRITDGDRPGLGLMGNWYFTEKWGTEKVVEDTSPRGNDCVRGTYDCYVPEEPFEDFDYSFVVIPDMQAMNYWKPANFLSQSEWIAGNAQRLNIKFACYLGDMVESRYDTGYSNSAPEKTRAEWATAQSCIGLLDGKVPYTVILGNHDYDNWAVKNRNATQFNEFFPYEKYSALDYFGGAYEEGDMSNTYILVRAGDVEYLIFALEYGPRQRVLNWMDRVIGEHPESRVIVTSHCIVNPQGLFVGEGSGSSAHTPSRTLSYDPTANDGVDMWKKHLKKHSNMFLSFSGHLCTDYVVMREDRGEAGNLVRSVLVNAQGSIMTSAMNTLLVVRVNERTKQMNFSYYSPEYGMVFNEQSQFTLSFADENNPAVGAAVSTAKTEENSEGKTSTGYVAEDAESRPANTAAYGIVAAAAGVAAVVAAGVCIRRDKR